MAKDIDLVRTARQRFRFPSNKLDYVANRLLGENKIHVPYQLWLDCMEGDHAAWATMKAYNKKDVEITEKLYTILRPWITNHPNHGLYVENQETPICRACGSDHVISKGWEVRTNVRSYQRYRCESCGWVGRGRKMIRGGVKSPQVIT